MLTIPNKFHNSKKKKCPINAILDQFIFGMLKSGRPLASFLQQNVNKTNAGLKNKQKKTALEVPLPIWYGFYGKPHTKFKTC